MTAGAFDAVRGGGATSPPQELLHILSSSQSTGLVVQDEETLKNIINEVQSNTSGEYSQLKFIVVLWTSNSDGRDGCDNGGTTTRVPIYTFNQVMDLGKESLERGETFSYDSSSPSPPSSPHLATLVYTSGTSGTPKAAALTHSNLLYQINNFPYFLNIRPGDSTLSLLPPWHIYERTCTYHILSRGACIIYTRIPKLKDDLKQYTPDHLVCVPLVLQTLYGRILSTLRNGKGVKRVIAMGLLAAALRYTKAKRVVEGVDLKFAQTTPTLWTSWWSSFILAWLTVSVLAPFKWLFNKLVAKKIRSALGVKRTIISGGGSLSPHLDDFYEAIDMDVLNGWGLTETSPVLTCRRVEMNVRGTVGMPIPGTELLVVDPESVEKWHQEGEGNGGGDGVVVVSSVTTDEASSSSSSSSSSSIKVLPDGQQGLLLARGPGVFLGYYNNPQATGRAFIKYNNKDWFDTGDLGWKVPHNNDGTIGTNIAGCVVLTGRAKDTIVLSSGENVVPQPIEDSITAGLRPLVKHAVLIGDNHRGLGVLLFVDQESVENEGYMLDTDTNTNKLEEVLKVGVEKATNKGPRWERVQGIRVVKVPLSVEDGTLTRTMKPRRAAIIAKYADDVAKLEAKLR
jgi:long-chain acyl-CoA synthetase